MSEIKPHISAWKKDQVKDIVKLFNEYPVAGIIDMQNLPALQFMKIRKQLKDKMYTKVTKRRLILKAIEQLKDKKNIGNLKQYLGGMPSLIFTKEDPFILQKQISKSKSNVAAKPGQIAPDDIKIDAGPTPFTPGPIIGELGKLGLKTEVKEGKIHLKEAKVLVKAGSVITPAVADLLTKLGIEPMTIGLNLVAAYENKTGEILEKKTLSVDEKEYVDNLKQIALWAVNLAAFIEYPDAEILKMVIKKAYLSGKSVAEKAKLEIKEDEKIELLEKPAKVEKSEPKVETKLVEKPVQQPKVEPKVEQVKKVEEVKVEKPKESGPEKKSEQPKVEIHKAQEKPVEQPKPVVQKTATEVKVEMKQEVKQDDVKMAQDVIRRLQDSKMNLTAPKTSDSPIRKRPLDKTKSVTDIINDLKDKKSRGEI